MNTLQIFNHPEFGDLRIIAQDEDPWLVGKDAATALGYSNTRDALARHVEPEDKADVGIHDGSQMRQITVINESGLYSLIMASKLPTAKRFKHWVIHDVLPAIRRKGYYSIIPDEQLAKALVDGMSDAWKLDHVIIPALREGNIDQSMLVAKYMGLTVQEYRSNSKLLRKSAQNFSAKMALSRWKGKAFTCDDIPEQYRDLPITLLALSKMRKRHTADGWFTEYCGTLYFNHFGYESIVDYLVRQKFLSLEEAAKWKQQIEFS